MIIVSESIQFFNLLVLFCINVADDTFEPRAEADIGLSL